MSFQILLVALAFIFFCCSFSTRTPLPPQLLYLFLLLVASAPPLLHLFPSPCRFGSATPSSFSSPCRFGSATPPSFPVTLSRRLRNSYPPYNFLIPLLIACRFSFHFFPFLIFDAHPPASATPPRSIFIFTLSSLWLHSSIAWAALLHCCHSRCRHWYPHEPR